MTDYAVIRERITGPLSVLECEVLADVASATTATRALEVGHYLGLSTAVLLDALPAGCELVTIDHHRGDEWVPAVPVEKFTANVEHHIGARPFRCVTEDMRTALADVGDGFGFVFYDADHSAAAVEEFWRLAVGLLDDHCTLVFDDADWDDQATLRTFAEADGFEVVTTQPFHRGEADKYDPSTYTLEVMDRG